MTSVAVVPNGKFAYVTNIFPGNNVTGYTINPSSGALAAIAGSPYFAGFYPVCVAVDPDGKFAYVVNFFRGTDTVSVINTATNSLLATLKVGWRPVDAAVTPDGSSVYVTNAGSDSVSVINTASNTVVATIPVGNEFPVHFRWSFFDRWRRSDPVHLAISPDGTRAYVTNAGSDNVSVINTATNTVVAT